MKMPATHTAAISVMKVGPAMRMHWIGSASIVEVTSISRRPSSASGK